MAEEPDPDVIARLYPRPEFVNAPPPTRPVSCFICVNAELGETTQCRYYGPVLNERLDAIGCWFFVEDLDAS